MFPLFRRSTFKLNQRYLETFRDRFSQTQTKKKAPMKRFFSFCLHFSIFPNLSTSIQYLNEILLVYIFFSSKENRLYVNTFYTEIYFHPLQAAMELYKKFIHFIISLLVPFSDEEGWKIAFLFYAKFHSS